MAGYIVRDSVRVTNEAHADLVTLKLSPQQAYRLAMNLLQQCQSKVEDRGGDYTTYVSFTARVERED